MKRFALALPALALLACNRAEAPKSPAPASAAPAHDHDHGASGADHAHGAGEAHADHAARHGGTFFMAPDGFHHVEGAYPEEGVFRVHLYDDHTQPIGPEGFSGRVEIAGRAEPVALEVDAATRTLVAKIDPPPAMPFDLQLWMTLPRDTQERLFDFRFTELSVPGAHQHAASHGGKVVEAGEHEHLELVASGGMAMLWVLDSEEKDIPVTGMTASLVVQRAAGAPETVALAAHGDHLMGALALAPGEAATVVATVKLPDGRTLAGRFSLP